MKLNILSDISAVWNSAPPYSRRRIERPRKNHVLPGIIFLNSMLCKPPYRVHCLLIKLPYVYPINRHFDWISRCRTWKFSFHGKRSVLRYTSKLWLKLLLRRITNTWIFEANISAKSINAKVDIRKILYPA